MIDGIEYAACTTDMTYGEAMDEIAKLKKQVTALNRALNDLRKEKT